VSKKEFPSPEQRISEPGNTGSCEKSYNFTKHPQRRRFSAFPASPEIAPNETLAICNFAIRKQKGTQCKLRLAIAQMIQTERSTRTFSLLSSETAHQNLHRLQKPDEQANSCKVKERRISDLCLVFGTKAQCVLWLTFGLLILSTSFQ
jgi:hypothetical protein